MSVNMAANENNTYPKSTHSLLEEVKGNGRLGNHIHPLFKVFTVMADLPARVGKMLAMRPMTIIPLRGGHPPFTKT